MCYRAGENAQIRALVEALGWPFEVKHLTYVPFGRLVEVWRGANLLGIVKGRSSPLEPPWPDLVVSSGMRNEPVCRWIRGQSGGRARYVHIGKPWDRVETFDLVVTAQEYPVPNAPNVVRNALSLHRVTPERLEAAAEAWAPRLLHVPRPFTAVLMGGYSGPYALGRSAATRLGRGASALARSLAGSLLVTTSARTSPAAIDALMAAVDVPVHLYRWKRDDADNPYLAYLALADAFIVTCESATMLAEACATGKPVYMFDLGAADGLQGAGGPILERLRALIEYDRLRAFLYRHVMWAIAPRRITRDIRVVHRFLVETGRAVWLGQPFPAHVPPPLDEMPRTVERVRALLVSRVSIQESVLKK
jgi:mitochondrial fission protein ELM1